MIDEIIKLLEAKSDSNIKQRYINNGVTNRIIGTKYSDIKTISKVYKNNNKLAIELYNSDIYECMYLSKYIFNKNDLNENLILNWVINAKNFNVIENILCQVAFYLENIEQIIFQNLDNKNDNLRLFSYCLYTQYISIEDSKNIDINRLKLDIQKVIKNIHDEENRIRYVMNNFLLSCGAYITELTDYILEISDQIKDVEIDMNGTYCKVPNIKPYIFKMQKMNKIGKKRKTAII